MGKYTTILTGQTDTETFLGYCFFAILGIGLSLLLHTTKRDPTTVYSPVKFSWKYMLKDNLKRITTSVITVYVCLRFTPEILTVSLNDFVAFGIGLGIDKLTEIIKSKTNLLNVKS